METEGNAFDPDLVSCPNYAPEHWAKIIVSLRRVAYCNLSRMCRETHDVSNWKHIGPDEIAARAERVSMWLECLCKEDDDRLEFLGPIYEHEFERELSKRRKSIRKIRDEQKFVSYALKEQRAASRPSKRRGPLLLAKLVGVAEGAGLKKTRQRYNPPVTAIDAVIEALRDVPMPPLKTTDGGGTWWNDGELAYWRDIADVNSLDASQVEIQREILRRDIYIADPVAEAILNEITPKYGAVEKSIRELQPIREYGIRLGERLLENLIRQNP